MQLPSGIVTNIAQFMKIRELNSVRINRYWNKAIDDSLLKTPIYQIFDLGRYGYKTFAPFLPTVLLRDVKTVEDRKIILQEIEKWMGSIIKYKNKENLVEHLLNKDILSNDWVDFFRSVRSKLRRVGLYHLLDLPVVSGIYFRYHKKLHSYEYMYDEKTINEHKTEMSMCWERFGNGYFFNTEGWGIMEKILAFLENRLPRSCPYSALQYIRHEDFYKAEIREGIVYGDVQIFEGIVKQIDLDEAETEYYESENESDENDTDQEFMDEDLPDEPPVLTRQNAFILG